MSREDYMNINAAKEVIKRIGLVHRHRLDFSETVTLTDLIAVLEALDSPVLEAMQSPEIPECGVIPGNLGKIDKSCECKHICMSKEFNENKGLICPACVKEQPTQSLSDKDIYQQFKNAYKAKYCTHSTLMECGKCIGLKDLAKECFQPTPAHEEKYICSQCAQSLAEKIKSKLFKTDIGICLDTMANDIFELVEPLIEQAFKDGFEAGKKAAIAEMKEKFESIV